MTPKEALKGIKQAIAEHLHKQTGVNVEKHFEYLQYDTEIDIIDKAITELEKLKRDVKRFIDLTFSDDINSDDWQEYLALKDKLSKVGKEDV